MKKIIVLILTVIFFMAGGAVFDIYAELPSLNILELKASVTSDPENPANYIFDQDLSTSGCFNNSATGGWVEITLNEKSFIYGIEIFSDISPDTSLYFEFEKDDEWQRFLGGRISGNPGEKYFIDLSFNNAVTKKIAFRITGPDLRFSRISEIKILGVPVKDELHLIPVNDVESTDNSCYFNTAANLLDRNVLTSWEIYPSKDLKDVFDNMKDFLNKNKNHNKQGYKRNYKNQKYKKSQYKNHGSVEFSFDEICFLEEIKLYFQENHKGIVKVLYENNGSWNVLDTVKSDDIEGWYSIDLEDRILQTQRIKITVKGHHSVIGGITEVEFWGYGGYEGDQYIPIGIPGPKVIDKPINYTFFIKEMDMTDTLCEIEVQNIDNDTFKIEINGEEYTSSNFFVSGESKIFIFKLAGNSLWSEDNFLRIRPSDDKNEIFISARLHYVQERGDYKLFNNSFDDGLLFSNLDDSEDIQLDFGRTLVLKNINLYALEYTKAAVYAETEDGWEELSLKEENPGFMVFDGNNISTKSIRIENRESVSISEIEVYASPTKDKAPDVFIIWPKDGCELSHSELKHGLVIGLVDNPDTKIYVNNIPADKKNNLFWINIGKLNLNNEGILTITAKAVDKQGREGKDIVEVFDKDYPLIHLDNQDKIVYTDEETFTVTGRVFYKHSELFINEEQTDVSRKGIFSHDVMLEEGLNMIKVALMSNHKKKEKRILCTLFLKVVRNSNGLSLSITSPENNSYLNTDSVIIRGIAEGAGKINVSVNNVEASIEGIYFYSQAVELTEGENRINVTAANEIGEEINEELIIYKDTVKPVIFNVTPSDGTISSSSSIIINGSINDLSPCWGFVNSKAVIIENGTFSTTISLDDGINPVVIEAEDAAGNHAQNYTFSVIIDTLPPEPFEVTANPPSWTNNKSPVISFSTIDITTGIDHYELSINEGAYITVSSPYQLPELNDGIHKIKVKAVDKAGLEMISETNVYIDTLAPEVPDLFNTIPGNGQVTLKWASPGTYNRIKNGIGEENTDVVAYKIVRIPEWNDGYKIITNLEMQQTENENGVLIIYQAGQFIDSELDNGDEYQYQIWAVDRAGNEGGTTEYLSSYVGLEVEEYEPETGAVVEYEGVILLIEDESLSEEIVKIEITEIESEDLEEEADFPVIGPIYEFSVIKEEEGVEEKMAHIEFEDDYIGVLTYDESLIPGDFPEQNLGVYYFDSMWGRWFRVEYSAVDVENNIIFFRTNHFTDFSVQPTMIQDITPQEIQDVGNSPFKTLNEQEGVTVSPQGGTAMTEVTEFILPGKNGFDFTLKRCYDSATARGDSLGLSANFELGISIGSNINAVGETTAEIKKSFNGSIGGDFQGMILNFFRNNGDFAYSTGIGWRINLPYICGGSSMVMVRLEDGSYHSMNKMKIVSNSNSIGIYRDIVLENHEHADFRLELKQVRANYVSTALTGSPINLPGWQLLSGRLIMRDGTVYEMDALGRTTRIVSPDGLNDIKIYYEEFDKVLEGDKEFKLGRIDHIEDSMGRIIMFDYDTDFLIPRIKKIWIENDPYERKVEYTLNSGVLADWDFVFPLLVKAEKSTVPNPSETNILEWNYDYTDYLLFAGEIGAKINIAVIIGEVVATALGAPGLVSFLTGLDMVTIKGNLQVEWVFTLTALEGPGIGRSLITYDKITLIRPVNTQAADYFLGLIPTAVEISIGMIQKLPVKQIKLYESDNTLIRTINYSYEFEYHSWKQFYNKKTIINDGKKESIYLFDAIVKERIRWIDWSDYLDNLATNLFTDMPIVYEIVPYNTEITVNDLSRTDSKFIEKTSMLWDPVNFRQIQQKIWRSSDNYKQIDYEYDCWGNIIYTSEYIITGNRTNEKREYKYFFENNVNPDPDDGWVPNEYNSYNQGLELEDYILRHDILLGKMEICNIPGSADSGINRKVCTYYKNNKSGQAVEELSWLNNAKTYKSYEYHPEHGSITKIKNPENHITEFEYIYNAGEHPDYGSDYNGLYVIRTIQKDVTDADGSVENITTEDIFEDISGWKVKEKNARGFITSYKYDSIGRETRIVKPGNAVTEIEYDDKNFITAVTNARGAVLNYDYDNLGRLIRISSKLRNRDMNGNLTSGYKNLVTKITYDSWDNIKSITDPRGEDPDYPGDYTVQYDYDAMGRMKKIIYPNEDGIIPIIEMNMNYSSNTLEKIQSVTVDDKFNGYSSVINKVLEKYDMEERLIETVKYDGDESIVTSIYYDGNGNESVIIDAMNNKTINIYNELNLITQTIYPEEEFFEKDLTQIKSPSIKYEYNKAGHKTKDIIQTLHDDIEIEYEVDGLGREIKSSKKYIFYNTGASNINTEEKKAVEKTYYDGNNNKIKLTDARNNEFRYEYSERDQIIKEINQSGNITSYTYDLEDNQKSMTDARGNIAVYTGDFTVEYYYDDLNRLIISKLPKSSEMLNKPVVRLSYDPRGNMIQRVEADGGKIEYKYTPRNKVKEEIRIGIVEGNEIRYKTTYKYDEAGNEMSSVIVGTDMNVYKTAKRYDGLNRLVEIKYPLGNNETYKYDKCDNQIEIIDGNNFSTFFEYDAYNRLKLLTDAEGANTRYWYDTRGNQTRMHDAKNNNTFYYYDEMDRLVMETDSLGYNTVFSYDGVGNKTGSLDPNENVGKYSYTPTNRLNDIVLENNGVTQTIQYEWDEAGDLKYVSNNNVRTEYNIVTAGDISSYIPDPYGRVLKKVQIIDGKEQTVEYEYDVMNRLIEITYPDGESINYLYNNLSQLTGVPGIIDTAPEYNNIGLIKQIKACNNVTCAYDYDDNQRLIFLEYSGSPDVLKKYNFSFDGANNIKEKNLSNYMYDKTNRLKYAVLDGKFEVDVRDEEFPDQKILNTVGDFTAYGILVKEIEDLDAEIKLDYGAMSIGVDLHEIYYVSKIELEPGSPGHRLDARSLGVFLSDNNVKDSYRELNDWVFNEREDGIIEILFRIPVEAKYVKLHCYYDERDREGRIDSDKATVVNNPADYIKVYYMEKKRTEEYGYDEKGNRTKITISGNENIDNKYTYYDNCDRLKSDGEYGYIWDNNGNLIIKGKYNTDEFYNENDFDKNSGEYWEYKYDLLNRLVEVKKSELDTGIISVIASYTYDTSNLRVKKVIPEENPEYYVFDENDNVLYEGNNEYYNNYIFVMGKHFARIMNENNNIKKYFYHTDHLGSTVMTTDEEGKIQWQDDYTPFGERTGEAGLIHDAVKFTGKDLDMDTGLYYFNARWYDSDAGRFISEDPVKDGLNWYVYCDNNPLVYYDPSGLNKITDRINVSQRAKKHERLLIFFTSNDKYYKTGKGTRNWSTKEKEDFVNNGTLKNLIGHHIRDVSNHSNRDMVNPDNILLVKGINEHMAMHDGNTRNDTDGELINRVDMLEQLTGKDIQYLETLEFKSDDNDKLEKIKRSITPEAKEKARKDLDAVIKKNEKIVKEKMDLQKKRKKNKN